MKRIFVPTKPTTSIMQWVWREKSGLFVEYRGGYTCKSDWTLLEIKKAGPEMGDGLPCKEITKI